MEEIHDMHCHLDFATDAINTAKTSRDLSICALCSTVMPSSFVSARAKFENNPNITVALGMHPWWVAKGRIGEADIARFIELQRNSAYIGEIGLDFSGQNRQSADKQIEVFAELLRSLSESTDEKLITIHAVKSAGKVMDEIEASGALDSNRFIFHWFSGTHEEFGRAVSSGFFFSVGMRMLATENGRTFAQAIPPEQLLLESDAPAHEGMDWDAQTWRQELDNTVIDLANLRDVNVETLFQTINENSLALLAN